MRRLIEDTAETNIVTVTLGAQKFAPIQYQSFDVGPYAVTTAARPGESIADVHARVMPELRAMAAKDYAESLRAHLDGVRQAAQGARGGR
jgi:hypothetical protein